MDTGIASASVYDQPEVRSEEATSLQIRFTAAGSEYFRIWIVNLLLTLVTLSLYWPFARARRLRFFRSNTVIGGHALGFHADPWKMFRGYVLVLIVGIGYAVLSTVAPGYQWIALLGFAAIWPALWRASMQFRTYYTRWRGLGFGCVGSRRGAYSVLLPLLLPAVLFSLAFVGIDPEASDVDPSALQTRFSALGVLVVAVVLMAPWWFARLKRYQQDHWVYAQEQTHWEGEGTKGFYVLGLIGVIGFLLAAAVILGGSWLVAYAAVTAGGADQPQAPGAPAMMLMVVAPLLIYAVLLVGIGPYVAARVQNLVWSNTVSARLRFHSALRAREMIAVVVTNWVLIIMTLGLYYPFAAVRLARLRLEAVAVEFRGDIEQWFADRARTQKGPVGDAAGDFFGLDVGL